jgi:hypothetical protein
MGPSPATVVEKTLCLGEGQTAIVLDTPAWFAWLEQASRFAYTAGGVRLTARKQPRGQHAFWYGYARCAGRVRGVYLGRTADLTATRLQAGLIQLHGPAAQGVDATTRCYGAHAAQARSVEQALAALMDIGPAGEQRLNLDRVRDDLDRRGAALTARQAVDPADMTYLLDLAATLVTELAHMRDVVARAGHGDAIPDVTRFAIGGPEQTAGEVL